MVYEYEILLCMTVFFLFAWIPSSIAKGQSFGMKWLGSSRKPVPGKELSEWGARAERAHNNLKDNFPGFVVAILLLGIMNKFDDTTATLALVYLLSRIIHFVSYIAGTFPLRALSYMVGLGVNVVLLFKALI